MIVKNEENNLIRCLESVKDIVDEIIIVDTGSTDSTVDIANRYGAKVFFYEWNNNFSDAKNLSLEHATGDWILMMDADDELEEADKPKLLKLLENKDIDVYFLETLSYVGKKPGLDMVCNLNVRLIRNHRGYIFKGAIHEQITCEICNSDKKRIRTEKVKFYHYGYLEKNIIEKNKRDRNMKILKKLLENNKNDAFTLFNIGNEYSAIGDYVKALEYYRKAYKNFNPNIGYGPRLFLRMALDLNRLGLFDEELEVIDRGLKYYPNFTDLEFLKASLFHYQGKITLSIKGYKKCLSMGEPLLYQKFISGSWSFRAYYALAEIHFELGDYNEAYNYCIQTLRVKPDFTLSLQRIADILLKKQIGIDSIKSRLENLFGSNLNKTSLIALSDIFFTLKKYNTAFEYLAKAEKVAGYSPDILFLQGMCMLHLKKFEKAYQCFYKVNSGEFYEKAVYKMVLCEILRGNTDNAAKLLNKTEKLENNDTGIVYMTLKDLIEDRDCKPISSDKKASVQFLNIIFDLLNIILNVASYETFEKSLQFLNLIESDEVLLRLAKLYYNNGFYNLACQEFMRSIKMFNRIDLEGLKMLRKILIAPQLKVKGWLD